MIYEVEFILLTSQGTKLPETPVWDQSGQMFDPKRVARSGTVAKFGTSWPHYIGP